jgi:hypothetical protein
MSRPGGVDVVYLESARYLTISVNLMHLYVLEIKLLFDQPS